MVFLSRLRNYTPTAQHIHIHCTLCTDKSNEVNSGGCHYPFQECVKGIIVKIVKCYFQNVLTPQGGGAIRCSAYFTRSCFKSGMRVCWATQQCAAQLSTVVVHSSISWWGCCQPLSCLIWEVECVTVYITYNLKHNCRHNLCYFSVFCSYLSPPGFAAFRFFQPLLHFFNLYKCLERDISLDPFYITHGHLTFFHIQYQWIHLRRKSI